jgi:ceramide glucosyltransferase
VNTVLLALLAGTAVFSLLSIVGAIRYLAVRPRAAHDFPPISILKPLSGLDDELESNLRTFFKQDYPAFEILFAVGDATDPAAAVVENLRAEFPGVASRLLIAGHPPYSNAKVHSLDRMLAAAANELVVMSDSDTRVTPALLRTIAAEFAGGQASGGEKGRPTGAPVGVATCPYRAVAGPSFWSRLEAIGLNTDFMAGILVARLLEGMQFAVGPTIAARRSVLESIGGFNRLKDYLAEDFVMGKLASKAGHGVMLSSYVIEHHIGSTNFRHNAAHRLRWVRSTRRSRPVGYVGQLFTMATPVVLLSCAIAPRLWLAAVVAMLIRAAAAYVVSARVLHARTNLALLPIEDLLGFCFWVAGFFGNTVMWRGRRYRVFADGKFEQVT